MDLTYYAYKCFLDSFVGSSDCANFLKEIMPDGFCESIYVKFWDRFDYGSVYFIKSFIKMCGIAKQQIPKFDEYKNCNGNSVLCGHNDFYSFEIEYDGFIKSDNVILRFYRNDKRHFLTMKTGSNRSGTTDVVENYDWLLNECYYSDDQEAKVFRIGTSVGLPERYGFFVIVTGNVYFCPYVHEETLSKDEDFKEFYESIKAARGW